MFEQFAWKFFQRLQQQGHALIKLAQSFLRATTQVDTSSILLLNPATNQLGRPNRIYLLHLQDHLQDTPRRRLQQLFTNTCAETFKKEGVPVSRIPLAYKQSSNIADIT
jgi:hypothetical protein